MGITKDIVDLLPTLDNYRQKKDFDAAVADKLNTTSGFVKKVRVKNQGLSTFDNEDAYNEMHSDTKVPIKDIRHGWVKTKDHSVSFVNPYYSPNNIDDIASRIESILNSYKSKIIRAIPTPPKRSDLAMSAIMTDVHVGMNPNESGMGLFDYEYNRGIYDTNVDKVFDAIVHNARIFGSIDTLFLDDYGDEQDGWDALTTRGGHTLDQNMSNIEVAEACIDANVRLITSIIDARLTTNIVIRKIENSNHSADFSSVINLAVEKIINALYQKEVVKIVHLKKHLNPFEWGDTLDILTHGKDKKHAKRPLPIRLSGNDIEYLSAYIRENGFDAFKRINIRKGDLHRRAYEETSLFTYTNYTSFAPPSLYVQHNFPSSRSGFDIEVFKKDDTIRHSTKIDFNYKRN